MELEAMGLGLEWIRIAVEPGTWTRPLVYSLAGVATVAAVAATVTVLRRWRRESPEAIECARRLRLHATGRMVSGEILDIMPVPDNEGLAPALVYQYEVGGVTYQVSQALHLVPVRLDPASWIPGWPVQVKFDPANPGNSIVVCEHWSGLPRAQGRAASPAAGTIH